MEDGVASEEGGGWTGERMEDRQWKGQKVDN
jgi:hypothetical protein